MAITSDNEELYWLTEEGVIKSTKDNWNETNLFYKVDECRKICANISHEAINLHISRLEAESEYSKNRIFSIYNDIFYDADDKVAFTVYADGNLYHGYEVYYLTYTKKELLNNLLSNFYCGDLYDISIKCSSGQIPAFAVADMLEIDESKKNYDPPINVGYGTIYV